MRQKVILLFMFLFGISNNASSLDMGISGAFFSKTSDSLPNVATIADMVFEQPNEAFLPEDSDAIIYEVVSLDEKKDEEKLPSIIDILSPSEPMIAKVEEKIEPIKPVVKKEKVSALRADDFIKPEIKQPRTLAKVKNDKFAKVKVSEGEEVLISSSEPVKPQPVEKKSKKKVVAKSEPKKISNVEKTVAKLDAPKASELSAPAVKITDATDESPFGVIVSKTKKKETKKNSIDSIKSPFIKAFSAIQPETTKSVAVNKTTPSVKKKKLSKTVVSSEILKKDLHRTYLSGNQYLSAYEDENEEALEEDVDEEINENEDENEEEYADDAGFEEQENVEDALEGKGDKKPSVEKVNVKDVKEKLSDAKKSLSAPSGPLKAGTREVLQMKIDFQNGSSAVSGESVNLIRSFAQIATEQPTNSIEITIPESVMNNPKKKKLTARRLSIVSNVLRNAGISDRQILPVLSSRDEDSFAFRVVSNDPYTKLRISKGTDIFGEEENVKEYNIMKW
ncbi:MAG: hypothetical protein IJ638_03110 [Alphaproteobacteria bacterium]|nr:hypothetical protein [Alphaproteobacteria bacterium]